MSVYIRGPLFEQDARRAVDQARSEVVEEVGGAGVEEVRSELAPGHGLLTGSYRDSIRSRRTGTGRSEVTTSQTGKGSYLEGRYAVFDKGTRALERRARGIADEHAKRLAERLGGR